MEIYLSFPISSYNQLSAVDSSILSRLIGFCVQVSRSLTHILSTLINFFYMYTGISNLIYKCIDADCFLCVYILVRFRISCFYTYIQWALISIQLLPSTYLVQCIYLTLTFSLIISVVHCFAFLNLVFGCLYINLQYLYINLFVSFFVYISV